MAEVRGPFSAGERALFIDRRGRKYVCTLRAGATFHTHAGGVEHDAVIGAPEGTELVTAKGATLLAFRPTLADSVLKMPRGAQVIYPKDLAAIVMHADVHAGVRVLEAGVGSGALSMALLRAGAGVVGYELREDFAGVARENVERFLGAGASYRVELRDVYEGIGEEDLDRVVLDLPEPWRVVGHAARTLWPGGIICAYLPTINQTATLVEALREGPFGDVRTVEVLERSWHVDGRSVRPDHRMVAHTGFLTVARTLASRSSEG